MMNPQQIAEIIRAGLDGAEVSVDGDGRHFQALIVTTAFEGKNPLQRHRMVYALLADKLRTDELHALSMRTLTPEQWARENP